jgi:aerobic carbon-monoxide dehydrogenase medium subunit
MVAVVTPSSLKEAVDIVRGSDGDAKYLGGGTALVLLVKMRMVNPELLVSLREVVDLPGWKDITVDNGLVRIGGGVTLTQLAANPSVRELLPSVAHSAGVVGNVRIRNCATVGGSMAEADYASDPPAALISLDARVQLHNGVRSREVAVADFITDFFTTVLEPDEIVTGVTVPLHDGVVRSSYLKFSSRSAADRPCVGVAASGAFDDGSPTELRVVIGAVSGRPQWFPDITAPHLGAPLGDSAVAEIADGYADAVDPVEDIRGSAWYRRQVVRAQVARSLRRISAGEVGA